MRIEELESALNERLNKALITPSVLIGRMRMLDESARKTSAYSDPRYMPFYYHLGVLLQPKRIVEVGFRLGLTASCVVQGANNVEHILAFQQKTDEYYSDRLAKANVKDYYKKAIDVYVGDITDDIFRDKVLAGWDLAIVDEEVNYDIYMSYFDVIWDNLADDAYLVVDYVTRQESASKAFVDFCRNRNRHPVWFNTRYGIGIIQK